MEPNQTKKRLKSARRKIATGPTTPQGKKASSLNALRHGLNLPIEKDLIYGEKVDRLAALLAGDKATPDALDCAYRVALAQMEVVRSRIQTREALVKPMRTKIRASQRLIKEKMKQLDVEEPGALDGVDGLERFTELFFGKFSEEPLDHLASRLSEMERIDRYHRRSLSKRKFALREFGNFFRIVKT